MSTISLRRLIKSFLILCHHVSCDDKKKSLGSSSVEIDHLDCYSIDVCCNSGSVKLNMYLDFVDTPPQYIL